MCSRAAVGGGMSRLRTKFMQDWNINYQQEAYYWNELVEKVNTDFDENRKQFRAFVGRKTKGKKYHLTKH